MKFTNGYWLIRPNFQMQYATQAVRVEKRPDALHVLSACRPIHHRGDTLDGGTLDVTYSIVIEQAAAGSVHYRITARPKE